MKKSLLLQIEHLNDNQFIESYDEMSPYFSETARGFFYEEKLVNRNFKNLNYIISLDCQSLNRDFAQKFADEFLIPKIDNSDFEYYILSWLRSNRSNFEENFENLQQINCEQDLCDYKFTIDLIVNEEHAANCVIKELEWPVNGIVNDFFDEI